MGKWFSLGGVPWNPPLCTNGSAGYLMQLSVNGENEPPPRSAYEIIGLRHDVGESWGMANNGEWQTVQYFVEGVKVINCFHPHSLTPLWQQ